MDIENTASNYGAQGTFIGPVNINAPAAAVHPRLRAPVADFAGRSHELDRLVFALRAATGGAASISGVRGMGGIGYV